MRNIQHRFVAQMRIRQIHEGSETHLGNMHDRFGLNSVWKLYAYSTLLELDEKLLSFRSEKQKPKVGSMHQLNEPSCEKEEACGPTRPASVEAPEGTAACVLNCGFMSA